MVSEVRSHNDMPLCAGSQKVESNKHQYKNADPEGADCSQANAQVLQGRFV